MRCRPKMTQTVSSRRVEECRTVHRSSRATDDRRKKLTETICYLLTRTDLPSLGRGKAGAHAHHAGSHLTWTLVVEPLLEGREVPEDVLEWHRQGGGFGTCAAVGGAGQLPLSRLEAVLSAATALGQRSGLVVDRTYPHLVDEEVFGLLDKTKFTEEPKRIRGGVIFFREEATCGWVLGDKKELEIVLRQFDLVPND